MKRPLPHTDAELTELSESLRALALRLVNDESTADDLVQEAWLAALDESPERVRNLTAWLRVVLRNLASRRMRGRRRRAEIEARAAARDEAPPVSELVERMSSFRLLRETTEELREPLRTVLVLRYFEGRSPPEIAAALDRPLETVRTQLQRGLRELRAALDRKHRGDRAAWSALVAALVGKRREGTPKLLGSVGGGVAALALAVAVAAVGWWLWPRGDADAPRAASAPPAPATDGDLARGTVTRSGAPNDGARRTPAPLEPAAPTPPDPEPAPPARAATRSLEVAVVDATGRPVAGARVEIGSLFPGRAGDVLVALETDERGVCRADLPLAELAGPPAFADPARGVRVWATAPGRAASIDYLIDVPEAGRAVRVPLRGPGQAIVGRVLDPNGAPIPGAGVEVADETVGTLEEQDGLSGTDHQFGTNADGDGRYELRGLRVARHRVTAFAPGRVLTASTVDSAEPVVELDLVLAPGATCAGWVKGPGGRPAAGARVWRPRLTKEPMHELEAVAGADGYFELAGLQPGPQLLFACGAGDPSLFADAILEVPEGADLEWSPELAPRAPFVAEVTDPEGEPVAGVGVVLHGRSGSAHQRWSLVSVTDEEGWVEVPHYPDTLLVCSAFHYGDRELPHTETLRPSELGGIHPIEVERRETSTGEIGGLLVAPEGGTMAGGRVLVYAMKSNLRSFVPVEPDGSFGDLRAAIGRSLFVYVDARGAVELGKHILGLGEPLDLGAIELGPTEDVAIRWPDDTPDDWQWSLSTHVDLRRAGERGEHVRDVPRGTPSVPLRPFEYALEAVDPGGRTVARVLFEVRAGRPVTVRAAGE